MPRMLNSKSLRLQVMTKLPRHSNKRSNKCRCNSKNFKLNSLLPNQPRHLCLIPMVLVMPLLVSNNKLVWFLCNRWCHNSNRCKWVECNSTLWCSNRCNNSRWWWWVVVWECSQVWWVCNNQWWEGRWEWWVSHKWWVVCLSNRWWWAACSNLWWEGRCMVSSHKWWECNNLVCKWEVILSNKWVMANSQWCNNNNKCSPIPTVTVAIKWTGWTLALIQALLPSLVISVDVTLLLPTGSIIVTHANLTSAKTVASNTPVELFWSEEDLHNPCVFDDLWLTFKNTYFRR